MISNTNDITSWINKPAPSYSNRLLSLSDAEMFAAAHYSYNLDKLRGLIVDPRELSSHGIATLPGELWVRIPYARRYAISNYGHFVLSIGRKSWYPIEVRETEDAKHYLMSYIYHDGEKISRKARLNILVEELFCRRYFDKELYDKIEHARLKATEWHHTYMEVHHLDCNVRNNVSSNLILLPKSVHGLLENIREYTLLLMGGKEIHCQNLDELTRFTGGRDAENILRLAAAASLKEAELKKQNNGSAQAEITFSVCDSSALGGTAKKKNYHAFPVRLTFQAEKEQLPVRPAEVLFTGGPNYKEKLADNLYFQSLRREAVI